MEKMEKYLTYAALIQGQIAEMFNEEGDGDYKISMEELQQGDNLTHFMHALANAVPCSLYSKITGDDVNILEFNHIANKLCFQYANAREKNSKK